MSRLAVVTAAPRNIGAKNDPISSRLDDDERIAKGKTVNLGFCSPTQVPS